MEDSSTHINEIFRDNSTTNRFKKKDKKYPKIGQNGNIIEYGTDNHRSK